MPRSQLALYCSVGVSSLDCQPLGELLMPLIIYEWRTLLVHPVAIVLALLRTLLILDGGSGRLRIAHGRRPDTLTSSPLGGIEAC